MSIVQIWQDFAMCSEKFPDLVCRPVAAIQVNNDVIALVLFEQVAHDIKIAAERHYRLVEPSQLSRAELQAYSTSPI